MPNEIYHRSEWGNPKAEGFGDVYFDASATNKLYKHSDNYENSDGTDKILRDIPNKASIVLTPTAYSDGSLNTVLPTDGNGDFDFSRGLSATRVNEKGLIEDVASGIPRIDYTSGQGALLLEPQRTNLVNQSEYLTDVSSATISYNQSTSPNGENNAMKLIADNTLNNHYVSSPTFSITSGGVVGSIFAKKGSVNWIRLRLNQSTLAVRAWFDLENGVVGNVDANGEAQIVDIGNGWYRCILIESGNTSISSIATLQIFVQNQNGQTSWDADGSEYIYIFGAQEENPAEYATSYIPTEGSTVTRSADVANNSGNADLFNDSEGVLYANIAALAEDSTNRFLGISDGSLSNRVNILYGSTNVITGQIQGSGSLTADGVNILLFNKSALKYKSGDNQLWVNGFKVDFNTSTSGATVGLNVLDLEAGNGNFDFYGNTKELAVFKEALTDAELESLTSWVSFVEMATDLEYTLE